MPVRARARCWSRRTPTASMPHTNADDATRYRDEAEVTGWLARDPIARLEAYLRAQRPAGRRRRRGRSAAEAEALAADVRTRMNADVQRRPAGAVRPRLRRHRPRSCCEQRALVQAELEAEADSADAPRRRRRAADGRRDR